MARTLAHQKCGGSAPSESPFDNISHNLGIVEIVEMFPFHLVESELHRKHATKMRRSRNNAVLGRLMLNKRGTLFVARGEA